MELHGFWLSGIRDAHLRKIVSIQEAWVPLPHNGGATRVRSDWAGFRQGVGVQSAAPIDDLFSPVHMQPADLGATSGATLLKFP